MSARELVATAGALVVGDQGLRAMDESSPRRAAMEKP